MQIAPDIETNTEDDIKYNVTAGMGHRFPGVNDLLLEFVQEGVVFLLLTGLFLVTILALLPFVLIYHLNIIKGIAICLSCIPDCIIHTFA